MKTLTTSALREYASAFLDEVKPFTAGTIQTDFYNVLACEAMSVPSAETPLMVPAKMVKLRQRHENNSVHPSYAMGDPYVYELASALVNLVSFHVLLKQLPALHTGMFERQLAIHECYLALVQDMHAAMLQLTMATESCAANWRGSAMSALIAATTVNPRKTATTGVLRLTTLDKIEEIAVKALTAYEELTTVTRQ